MPNTLRDTLMLMSSAERRRLYGILVLSAVAAVAQALAILSIMPFILLLTSPSMIGSNPYLVAVSEFLATDGLYENLAVFGAVAVLVLTIGNALVALEHWATSRFLSSLGCRLGMRALDSVLARPYSFFLHERSSRLSDAILTQVERLTGGVVGQIIVVVSNAALALLVVASLLIVSFQTTLTTLVVLLSLFLGVYLFLRPRIHRHGEELTQLSSELLGVVKDTLDGIREIKVRQVERFFARRFERPALRMAELEKQFSVLNAVPNLVVETVIFAGLIGAATFFIYATEDPALALSLIALYGFAAYRIVPSMQAVFEGLSTIHHSADAVTVVQQYTDRTESGIQRRQVPPLEAKLELRGVSYGFREDEVRVLDNVNLSIQAGSSICLFGPSGSGKSTLLNIIVGLLRPNGGRLLCDGLPIGESEVDSWRRQIGFCPQQVFLYQGSPAANVAFGVPEDEIDGRLVARALRLARLEEFVSAKDDRSIAEQGKNLSGGQAQRIGLARALYHDPGVLVLDEAFEGLDHGVRDAILDSLFALSGKTLILASHDPAVAARCDRVFTIRRGDIEEIELANGRAPATELNAGQVSR